MAPSLEPTAASSQTSRPVPMRMVTPGFEHFNRTVQLLGLPHGRVQKICCIGAGYVVSVFQHAVQNCGAAPWSGRDAVLA